MDLAAYRERQPVVVAFFPLAFSSVCMEEICQLQEDMAAWDALGAAVLGVSVDSIFVNLKFAEETGATFPILRGTPQPMGSASCASARKVSRWCWTTGYRGVSVGRRGR